MDDEQEPEPGNGEAGSETGQLSESLAGEPMLQSLAADQRLWVGFQTFLAALQANKTMPSWRFELAQPDGVIQVIGAPGEIPEFSYLQADEHESVDTSGLGNNGVFAVYEHPDEKDVEKIEDDEDADE
ncbi:hypothetical protein [Sinomonas humi]|uniref:Uncharacterized protein n=1 Tax=Sinomonas humi TaxID=1338436 RepID=A0A0B2AAP8_9MICC|nr:hypothetical protein [Sinomonas humi]KHL00230.1 hypothetical protein LK10_20680 [Sinomonas humi]